jgi:hypothetical protein
MWTYAAGAQAFAFQIRLSTNERKKLLRALDRMAQHPPPGEPAGFKDDAGRDMRVWRDDGFEFLFWPDHAARELRIVEIEFVRP